jgi:hypothetical protein
MACLLPVSPQLVAVSQDREEALNREKRGWALSCLQSTYQSGCGADLLILGETVNGAYYSFMKVAIELQPQTRSKTAKHAC